MDNFKKNNINKKILKIIKLYICKNRERNYFYKLFIFKETKLSIIKFREKKI